MALDRGDTGRGTRVTRTDLYPDNERSEWVVTPLTVGIRRAGVLVYSAEVHANQTSKDAGGRPFLINSWKSQIRGNTPEGEHQRIQIDGLGRMLHASGEHVTPEDVEDFLLLPSTLRWFNDTGQFLPPFMFPTYDGTLEGLDPQWLRERYSLSVDGQVEANIDRYLRGAEIRKLSGDHRGTTQNLVVGANNDDAQETDSDTSVQRALSTLSCSSTIGLRGFRFQGVTGLSGVTIDAATFSVYHFTTSVDSPDLIIAAEESATPPEFVETNGNISGRTTTTATVTWTASDLGANAYHSAPDVKAVIQELADTYNSSEIVIANLDNGSSADACRSYDFNSAQAGKLDIDTPAAGGVIVLRRRREGA